MILVLVDLPTASQGQGFLKFQTLKGLIFHEFVHLKCVLSSFQFMPVSGGTGAGLLKEAARSPVCRYKMPMIISLSPQNQIQDALPLIHRLQMYLRK